MVVSSETRVKRGAWCGWTANIQQMQQSVGSSTPQPPPLELLAHEWGQPNIESESELAKLKASIVEEAARELWSEGHWC